MSWYCTSFDVNWIKCRSCGHKYYIGRDDKNKYKRRNKCPNCKVDNKLCRKIKKADIEKSKGNTKRDK